MTSKNYNSRKSSMKSIPTIFLTLLLFLSPSVMGEGLTDLKKMCEEKCSEVVSMIKQSGIELTFKEINKRDGKFVWDDSFVYAIDIKKGIILAHNNRRMIGNLVSGITNINGRKIYIEFMEMGERNKSGWVTYMWKNRLKYVQRHTYVIKVPDSDILVLASTYNQREESSDDKKPELAK